MADRSIGSSKSLHRFIVSFRFDGFFSLAVSHRETEVTRLGSDRLKLNKIETFRCWIKYSNISRVICSEIKRRGKTYEIIIIFLSKLIIHFYYIKLVELNGSKNSIIISPLLFSLFSSSFSFGANLSFALFERSNPNITRFEFDQLVKIEYIYIYSSSLPPLKNKMKHREQFIEIGMKRKNITLKIDNKKRIDPSSSERSAMLWNRFSTRSRTRRRKLNGDVKHPRKFHRNARIHDAK